MNGMRGRPPRGQEAPTSPPSSLSVSDGGVGQLLMTSDGAVYVQGYGVTQSDLVLVKGLR